MAQIRLTGHRIDLFHVVEKYQEGYSPEMLHEEYPTLCLELIHRVIRFYLANQAEVDAYVAETIAEVERQSAAGKRSTGQNWSGVSLSAMGRRLWLS